MIKLLLVSSLRSKELGDFLTERGAFEVYGCYSSLSSDVAEIQNQIIKVDKTLYLYQLDDEGNSNVNIRADMQVLQGLLNNNTFFNPGEIIFMTQNSLQCEQAERYFTTVMTECGYDNYSIKKIDGQLSFSEIYSALMGISITNNFKNSYKPLYRVERNSDSSIAYDGQDDSNLSLEPFRFDELKSYENRKSLAVKTASTVPFKDPIDEVERFKDPDFSEMKLDDSLFKDNVSVLTGKSKSGLTTWTVALAVSAVAASKSVLILDYTSNSDVQPVLSSNGVDFEKKSMKDLLRKSSAAGVGLEVCSIVNDREEQVKLNFLQRFLNLNGNRYDVILIPVAENNFRQVYSLVQESLNKVFFTVVPRRTDVVELQKYIHCVKESKVMILLDECVSLVHDSYIAQEEVKKILSFFNPKVVSSYVFKDFKLKPTLYNKILIA